MHYSNEAPSQELVTLSKRDLSIREELVADGTLGSYGYHPRMEAVHKENTARLSSIIEQYGWPRMSLVGEEGTHAAWLIVQHSIGNPPFMRHCLSLLKKAAIENEAPPWQAAMLEDRICMFEGRPQVYGSQFRSDKNGELNPFPIENPEFVNRRRLEVGLNTIEEITAEHRVVNARENIQTPVDFEKQYEKWLYSVGWRKREEQVCL